MSCISVHHKVPLCSALSFAPSLLGGTPGHRREVERLLLPPLRKQSLLLLFLKQRRAHSPILHRCAA
eukprot:CAMPEP_0119375754 /NCGR_PEP_ID=MMETSP1334-20130426/36596_1 /TAXON_ID=127549 /ORGANISM="Calcidiscus leptoporus, Strain RCC1130" /LENGTH=66 /DNA_ID=CAMNT_0007394137 /DNA_START=185 /DNA_END=382 /DNA_ORIENTATION=+